MRSLVAVALIGCAGNTLPPPAGDDVPDVDAPVTPTDGDPGLEPGSLAVTWMHGSANCNTNTDPEVQVHAYNATTLIIRQNKCDTFEAPFVYVLLGSDTALLFDSGATQSTTLRQTVSGLIGSRALLVAHTHAHGDHTAGDGTFTGQPNTTVVAKSQAAIQATFGIATWPTDLGSIDLGGRVLDAVAIPGHEAQHIALYDRNTGLLLTGDTLYPGHLFISNWSQYHDSVIRLAEFAATRPIAHVLGAHVEMTSTPGQAYPYGTTFQPAEHVLELTAAHLEELRAAVVQLGPSTPNGGPFVHDDFSIEP